MTVTTSFIFKSNQIKVARGDGDGGGRGLVLDTSYGVPRPGAQYW